MLHPSAKVRGVQLAKNDVGSVFDLVLQKKLQFSGRFQFYKINRGFSFFRFDFFYICLS